MIMCKKSSFIHYFLFVSISLQKLIWDAILISAGLLGKANLKKRLS